MSNFYFLVLYVSLFNFFLGAENYFNQTGTTHSLTHGKKSSLSAEVIDNSLGSINNVKEVSMTSNGNFIIDTQENNNQSFEVIDNHEKTDRKNFFETIHEDLTNVSPESGKKSPLQLFKMQVCELGKKSIAKISIGTINRMSVKNKDIKNENLETLDYQVPKSSLFQKISLFFYPIRKKLRVCCKKRHDSNPFEVSREVPKAKRIIVFCCLANGLSRFANASTINDIPFFNELNNTWSCVFYDTYTTNYYGTNYGHDGCYYFVPVTPIGYQLYETTRVPANTITANCIQSCSNFLTYNVVSSNLNNQVNICKTNETNNILSYDSKGCNLYLPRINETGYSYEYNYFNSKLCNTNIWDFSILSNVISQSNSFFFQGHIIKTKKYDFFPIFTSDINYNNTIISSNISPKTRSPYFYNCVDNVPVNSPNDFYYTTISPNGYNTFQQIGSSGLFIQNPFLEVTKNSISNQPLQVSYCYNNSVFLGHEKPWINSQLITNNDTACITGLSSCHNGLNITLNNYVEARINKTYFYDQIESIQNTPNIIQWLQDNVNLYNISSNNSTNDNFYSFFLNIDINPETLYDLPQSKQQSNDINGKNSNFFSSYISFFNINPSYFIYITNNTSPFYSQLVNGNNSQNIVINNRSIDCSKCMPDIIASVEYEPFFSPKVNSCNSSDHFLHYFPLSENNVTFIGTGSSASTWCQIRNDPTIGDSVYTRITYETDFFFLLENYLGNETAENTINNFWPSLEKYLPSASFSKYWNYDDWVVSDYNYQEECTFTSGELINTYSIKNAITGPANNITTNALKSVFNLNPIFISDENETIFVVDYQYYSMNIKNIENNAFYSKIIFDKSTNNVLGCNIASVPQIPSNVTNSMESTYEFLCLPLSNYGIPMSEEQPTRIKPNEIQLFQTISGGKLSLYNVIKKNIQKQITSNNTYYDLNNITILPNFTNSNFNFPMYLDGYTNQQFACNVTTISKFNYTWPNSYICSSSQGVIDYLMQFLFTKISTNTTQSSLVNSQGQIWLECLNPAKKSLNGCNQGTTCSLFTPFGQNLCCNLFANNNPIEFSNINTQYTNASGYCTTYFQNNGEPSYNNSYGPFFNINQNDVSLVSYNAQNSTFIKVPEIFVPICLPSNYTLTQAEPLQINPPQAVNQTNNTCNSTKIFRVIMLDQTTKNFEVFPLSISNCLVIIGTIGMCFLYYSGMKKLVDAINFYKEQIKLLNQKSKSEDGKKKLQENLDAMTRKLEKFVRINRKSKNVDNYSIGKTLEEYNKMYKYLYILNTSTNVLNAINNFFILITYNTKNDCESSSSYKIASSVITLMSLGFLVTSVLVLKKEREKKKENSSIQIKDSLSIKEREEQIIKIIGHDNIRHFIEIFYPIIPQLFNFGSAAFTGVAIYKVIQ